MGKERPPNVTVSIFTVSCFGTNRDLNGIVPHKEIFWN